MRILVRTYRRLFSVVVLTAMGSLLLAPDAKAQVGDYRNDFVIGFNGGYQLNKIAFETAYRRICLEA